MERRSLYYDEGTLSETFGRPPSDEAGVLRGMRLSLLVVLADGPAPGAIEGLFEAMRRFGMSEESLRVLRDFKPEGARFTDHIPAEVAPGSAHARRLVYALVAGALGDGVFGSGERRAVEEIAAHLALGPGVVAAMAALLQMERSVRDMRLALFSDDFDGGGR